MKIIFTTIFLATSIVFMCKADNSVAVGTNSIPIVFPSSLNSEPDREFVSSDLAKIFSFAKTIDVAFTTSSASEYMELKRYQAPPPFPTDLRKQLKLSHTNELFSMIISEELASRYFTAKNFAQTNAVLLGQFDNIVTIFNNGSVTNISVAAQKEIFWMPKDSEISDGEMSEIIHVISSRLVLHYPSILNHEKNLPLDTNAEADIAEVFVFIVASDRDTGDFVRTFGIVKIGNNVKLFVFLRFSSSFF